MIALDYVKILTAELTLTGDFIMADGLYYLFSSRFVLKKPSLFSSTLSTTLNFLSEK